MPRYSKLLVLDLDETLISAHERALDREADFTVGEYHVYKRPHVEKFLETCGQWFDIGVWTSATEAYACVVISYVFPRPDALKFVWCRPRCTRTYDYGDGGHLLRVVKDMKKLVRKGYRRENIIVIEDSPESVKRNYGNAIIVPRFVGEADDTVLLDLLDYLELLGPAENIRNIDKRTWRRDRDSGLRMSTTAARLQSNSATKHNSGITS